MSAETVQPMIEPCPGQMRQHVEHLFGGWLDGCHDGKIELAWCDGKDGKLKHAAIYHTDQLDELVERAVQVNRIPGQNVYIGQALRKPDIPPFGRCRIPGQNVYIGQALRKPDIPPFGRCTDDDFFALTAFYVDIDDDVLSRARERYRRAGCPPTAVVVTGRQPHTRAQMLWRLEIPERDADLCRRQNLALATALGADTTVVNPSRVLRLGGSIAWPAKPGRVLERTEFHVFNDGRPKVYVDGQLAGAFPPKPAASARPGAVAGDPIEPTTSPKRDLTIGSEFDGVSVKACLARIRAGDHWHDNLVRLTGSWIARGWSDEEILTAAEGLTLAGYSTNQTRGEVAQMIEGGRAKWNIANPEHAVEDERAMKPLAPNVLEELNVAMLPRRRWLLGRSLLRRKLTVKVAATGVGKSTLSVARAVAVATGRAITGEPVHERTKVWIYNNEDDDEDLKRQLAAVLQHWDIPFAEVKGLLAVNSGADRPLLVARTDRNGTVLRLPDVDACIRHIRERQYGLFVVDPSTRSSRRMSRTRTPTRRFGRSAPCSATSPIKQSARSCSFTTQESRRRGRVTAMPATRTPPVGQRAGRRRPHRTDPVLDEPARRATV